VFGMGTGVSSSLSPPEIVLLNRGFRQVIRVWAVAQGKNGQASRPIRIG
jgi:hypothetical protein